MSTTAADRTIRRLSEGDIAALQALDEHAHGERWSQRTFADELTKPDRLHLVADSAGEFVGHAAAWIDGACCRVTNVAVAADHVGNGHASALLLALLRTALTHQIANVQLEVRPTNRRAQRMYSRFGFVPVGIERNFYDRSDALGNRDALVMAVVDVCAGPWRDRLDQIEADLNPTPETSGAPT